MSNNKEITMKIIERLKKDLNTKEIEYFEVEKLNNEEKYGIRISFMNPSPTFYTSDLLKEGKKEKDIIKFIKEEIKNTKEFNPDIIEHYEDIKNSIYPLFLSKELNNEERLSDLIHYEHEDLIVIFYISLEIKEGLKGSVKITKSLLKSWNKTTSDIKDQAFKNIKGKTYFGHIFDALKNNSLYHVNEYTDEEELRYRLFNEQSPDFEMYTLTNDSKYYGNGVLANIEFLDMLHEVIGDYWIIPSSLHEVIIVKKQENDEIEKLKKIIKEINDNEVEIKDRFSYNLYDYGYIKDFMIFNSLQN